MAMGEDAYWREEAAYQLFFHYKELPDKEQAWEDLCYLTNDKINRVRWSATEALGEAFPYIPNKLQAWDNLHRLTSDEEYIVRIFAAEAVGVAFSYVLDKKQAWDDLYRLAQDENRTVRPTAFLSLGKASIFKATNAENKENFKKDMEEAISYFEKSLTQIFFTNPARFCLPFYRSFYTLVFKTEADVEVQKYLAEARSAVEGSESKGELLKIVENVEKALKEVQKAKDLNSKKCDLNVIRMYCENAENLIDAVKERAPLAAEIMRKGMPLIEKNIKELLDEIQEKAKDVCWQSKGTPVEEIACAVSEEVQGWYYVGDQKQMARNVEKLFFVIRSKIPSTSENKHIHDKIEEIRNEKDVLMQYDWLIALIGLIPYANIHAGDSITVSDVTASGENIQVVVKGNENKKISESISSEVEEQSWTTWFSPHATYAALIGFLATEIGTYLYPTAYNHLISVIIALLTFVIVAIFDKRRRSQRKDTF